MYKNKAYNKKRVIDKDLFDLVRFQSWFWEGKERYWFVDENKKEEANVNSTSVTIGENARTNSDNEESNKNALEKSNSQLLLEQLKQEY